MMAVSNGKIIQVATCAAIFCYNDELSLTSLDCLQTNLEGFILFAKINQIPLKTSSTSILLIFMQSENL